MCEARLALASAQFGGAGTRRPLDVRLHRDLPFLDSIRGPCEKVIDGHVVEKARSLAPSTVDRHTTATQYAPVGTHCQQNRGLASAG
jgi:hypothetical protein